MHGTRWMGVALLAGLVVQSGCAHGKVTQVRKELGGVGRSESIFVREFETGKAEFLRSLRGGDETRTQSAPH